MTNANLAAAKSYFTALQTGDMAGLDALLADDLVWHQPGKNPFSGTHTGKAAVYQMIGGMMAASQGSFAITQTTSFACNGDLVAVTIEFSAQTPVSKMQMGGVDLLRIEGGLIKEVWLFSADQGGEDQFWSTTA
jgi:uncharacterized protein